MLLQENEAATKAQKRKIYTCPQTFCNGLALTSPFMMMIRRRTRMKKMRKRRRKRRKMSRKRRKRRRRISRKMRRRHRKGNRNTLKTFTPRSFSLF